MRGKEITGLINSQKDCKSWLIAGNGVSVAEYSGQVYSDFEGYTMGNNRICNFPGDDNIHGSDSAFFPDAYVNVEISPWSFFPWLEKHWKDGKLNWFRGRGSSHDHADWILNHTGLKRGAWNPNRDGKIAWSGTSSFMMLSLAYQLGLGKGATLYIVGIDLKRGKNGMGYFTGEKPASGSFYLNEKHHLNKAVNDGFGLGFKFLKDLGVEIIDLSPYGKLPEMFPDLIKRGDLPGAKRCSTKLAS